MESTGGDFGQILDSIRFISSESVKRPLIWTIVFLLVADTLLFIGTLLHRLVVDIRDRAYRRAYEKYTDQVIMAMYGEGHVDTPVKNIEKEALGDVCIEISRKFKGEEGSFARQVARDKGIVEYYSGKLKSIFLATRVVYYEKLSYLQVFEVKEELKREIVDAHEDWAIARLCHSYSMLLERVEEIEFLFRNLSRCETLSFKFLEFVWFNVIARFHESWKEFLEFVRDYVLPVEPPMVVRSFVEACGSYRFTEARGLIEEIYSSNKEDTIMLLSCIRALGNMGYENFCNILTENWQHPDWRVRAVVCKYAYLCESGTALPLLKAMLGDSSYYVRINAGRAILFFKEEAPSVLEELLNSEDRFVRDTARYLLEELEAGIA